MHNVIRQYLLVGGNSMIYSIKKGNFEKLMEMQQFHLPKRWNGGNFRDELNELFYMYLKEVKIVVNNDDDFKVINRVCKRIIKCIEHYYNGYTSSAFTMFSTTMEELMKYPFRIYHKSGEMIRVREMDELKLYRVRNVTENKLYTPKDIFHTPFSIRSKVGTCRYSIAGYPCLYLATNLNLCEFETPKASNSEITLAARFEINRRSNDNNDIRVIELGVKPQHFLGPTISDVNSYDKERTINRLNEIDLSNPITMLHYLIWYPLIAASSYIRISKRDPFASEYIIPQLLMEWVRVQSKKNEFYGIRYFSCANERASEIGMNYVFPTFYDEKTTTNFCTVLSKLFQVTNPVCVNNYLSIWDTQMDLDKMRAHAVIP